MKVRREARTLKGGALCSLRRAVTAFHSCGDDGRVTCVLLHCPPVARFGMRSTCPALYEMSDYFSLRGRIIAMSRRTIAVSAALLIISSNVARADSCPPPTIVKTLVGAPIFSTRTPTFWFANVNDNNFYGIPLDAVLDANGNVVAGVLDPQGCRPPLAGRAIMANQIINIATQSMFIQGMNAAFGTNMPWITYPSL